MVLGNLDAKTLGEERAKALVKFVEEGGSLILLGGDDAWGEEGFAKTALKGLMPVTRAAAQPPQEGKFNVVVSKEGQTHPALQNVAQKWAKPMPVLSIFPGTDPSRAAQVVMTADEKPLVVTQQFRARWPPFSPTPSGAGSWNLARRRNTRRSGTVCSSG